MKHKLDRTLLTRPAKVLVVGAGGTGSHVLTALATIDHALRALGGPGFEVHVTDPDQVSPANVGRQMFYPADVGQYKSQILVHRINMAMGLHWKAFTARLQASDRLCYDVVIGCVDSRNARFSILRAMERGSASLPYLLDFGNAKDYGQVVLGQVSRSSRKLNPANKLPHIGELFPDAVNPLLDDGDDTPSCSVAEALEKQSLFINRAVTVHGMDILWQLFRAGEISEHGCFVNLKTGNTRPIPVDPEVWKRLGYTEVKQPIRLKKFRSAAEAAAAM